MDIKDVRTVADLDKHFPQACLVSTDYEVEDICHNINADCDEYPCLFVWLDDAELIAVWGCTTSIPWLDSSVDLLYPSV